MASPSNSSFVLARWQHRTRDSRKLRQKIAINVANFCEKGKNHGKITASNYGPKNHYKVYKTQHLALTTIITCRAKFSFCKILSLWSIKVQISTTTSQSNIEQVTKHKDFGSSSKSYYFCVKITPLVLIKNGKSL